MKESNDMTNINMNQLRADRRELEEQIRQVKKELRSCWTRPMGKEQYELIRLKLEATELCILRAWLRGRHHLPDVDRCRETAERRLQDYQTEAA